jgi:hypothetical protein
VTLGTVLGQNRLHIPLKINGLRLSESAAGQQANQTGHQGNA